MIISSHDQALKYLSEANYSKAFELLQECLVQNNWDNGEISFQCGWCLELAQEGDKKRAIDYYQKASEISLLPGIKTNSLFRIGWLLIQDKQWLDASLVLKKCIDLAQSFNLKDEVYRHALFWFAVCLESLECYLDAVKWYRVVQDQAPHLGPESAYREIICLDLIANYEEALQKCISFNPIPPEGFDQKRHEELFYLVQQEKELLLKCMP